MENKNSRVPTRLPDSHKLLLDIKSSLIKLARLTSLLRARIIIALERIESLFSENNAFHSYFRKKLTKLRQALKYYEYTGRESSIRKAAVLLRERLNLVLKYKAQIIKKHEAVVQKEERVELETNGTKVSGRLFTCEKNVNADSNLNQDVQSIHRNIAKIQKCLPCSKLLYDTNLDILRVTDRLRVLVTWDRKMLSILEPEIAVLKQLMEEGPRSGEKVLAVVKTLEDIVATIRPDGGQKPLNSNKLVKSHVLRDATLRTQILQIDMDMPQDNGDNRPKYKMVFSKQELLVDN